MYDPEDTNLCDEEKSYHEWLEQNLQYIQQNKNHISVMKKLYMAGFAAGFQYKRKIAAQEYLQK